VQTNYLITTRACVERRTAAVRTAIQCRVPLVERRFVDACRAAGKLVQHYDYSLLRYGAAAATATSRGRLASTALNERAMSYWVAPCTGMPTRTRGTRPARCRAGTSQARTPTRRT